MSVNLDKEVNWGIIGAGYISRIAMKPAFENSKVSKLLSVASKDADRGKFLNPSGRVYTEYENLLNDPDVEAVYIALPNSLHIEYSIKALRAGKHVLCEKPIALNVAELQQAISVANSTGLSFVEASWNRWHPRTDRLKEIVDSGLIGEVRNIKSAFTYDGLNPNNIRAFPELGGGSLYDLGPYAVAAPIWIMDFAPISNLKADVTWHSQGCDETVNLQFDIGGAHAQTLTSMNIEKPFT
jgi:predicted dehydrogenase